MADSNFQDDHIGSFSRRQQLFFRYTYFILIDLTVLNLFDQFWDLVVIDNFLISLLTALLLQVLLQVTIAIEHRIAAYFKSKSGVSARVLRGLSTWAILFGSKLVILEAINIAFGDNVVFAGPMHGLVAFVAVVVAIICAEQLMLWIYRKLA
jgi:hypothetical protein